MMRTRAKLYTLLLMAGSLSGFAAKPAFSQRSAAHILFVGSGQSLPNNLDWLSVRLLASGFFQAADNSWNLNWVLYALVGWLGGMLLLFLLGNFLSHLTLAAVAPERVGMLAEPHPIEKLVRTIYRVLIALTSLYFYVSIPFLILLILGLAGAIFYLFFQAGRIPVRAAVALGLGVIYTLYAIVRSIFSIVKDQEPGRPLGRSDAPDLWQVTDEVAQKLNTSPIESIFITPGTQIGVMERGSLLKKMAGQGNRALILGIGVLPGLNLGPFKAILAHEYGHFRGKDTAGGHLARQVQVSIHNMALGLALSRQASWYNPAWLFINGFNRLYLRITHGASRLQEILADRHAIFGYGAENMIEGLNHVVRASILFNYKINNEVQQALSYQRKMNNVYSLPPPTDEAEVGKIDEAFRKAMEQKTSVYDTHPSPAARIRMIEHFPENRSAEADDNRPALNLLPNISHIEKEMMTIIKKNIYNRLKLAQAG